MDQSLSDSMTVNKLVLCNILYYSNTENVLFDIFRNIKWNCKFGDHRIQLKITIVRFENCMQKKKRKEKLKTK